MDASGKLGLLLRATGEAGEACLAGAEGTVGRHPEDGQIHGILPATCYAGHTRTACLVEGPTKGASKAPGIAIDIQQYKPTWVVGGTSATPNELDFPSSTAGKWEGELDKLDELVDLDVMHCAESALGKVSLPTKAHFVLGKVVHA